MASRQALRRAWWQVHKWTALLLMILLMPLGLSGVVLAWDDAIDHPLHPQRYAVHTAATLLPSAYATAAAHVLQPGDRISMIRYPDGIGPVVVMASNVAGGGHRGDHALRGDAQKTSGRAGQGNDGSRRRDKHDGGAAHGAAMPDAGHQDVGKRGAQQDKAVRGGPPLRVTLWLDPADGHLLDQTRGDSGLVRVAHNFHGSLFFPGIGRALVGLLGVAMFLMAAGGVWLWWPTVGSLSSGFRWKRGDRRFDSNLHHTVGFWVALPLAFQAFTGVWIAWPQMMATVGLAAPSGGMGERSRMVPVAHPALTPDAALAAARATLAGVPASLSWPSGEDGPWRLSLSTATGHVDLTVDDTTGVAAIAPRRGGLALAIRHLHDGTTLGTGWRVVMIIWGLAPTVLGITGLIMWWRGRRWRADLARRRERVREAATAG